MPRSELSAWALGNSHRAVYVWQNMMFPNDIRLKLADKMAEIAKSHMITPDPVGFM